MEIIINNRKDTFHLCNQEISYIMTVLPNGQMGQLYFGKRIRTDPGPGRFFLSSGDHRPAYDFLCL